MSRYDPETFRVSRKATEAELAKLSTELSRFDGVVASTFFSPGEQRLLDELLASDTSRLIWILPMGMPGQVPVKWCPRPSPLPRALAVSLSRRHDRRHTRKLPRLQRVGNAPRHRLSPIRVLQRPRLNPHFLIDLFPHAR